MIAALYSSKCDGTKEFTKDGTTFEWKSIENVYKADLLRAKGGISRRVPDLKFSRIVFKKIQVRTVIGNFFLTLTK